MRFLNTKEALLEIRKQFETSSTADLAVAFWGKGAPEELGISKSQARLTVICNLSMGGTNPAVIRSLRTTHGAPTVRQNDRLHAKVYLFAHAAVIGSSNASANGLALEGSELTHWDEANMLVTDKEALESIRTWIAKLTSRAISEQDLARADVKWKNRRSEAPVPGKTVLQVLREDPEQFRNRKAYLVIYFEDLDAEGVAAQREIQEESSDRAGIFQDWPELPDEGLLVCFMRKKASFRWDGVWRRKPEDPDIPRNGRTNHIAWEEDDVHGLTVDRDLAAWKKLCQRVVNGKRKKRGIVEPLYDLRKLLED